MNAAKQIMAVSDEDFTKQQVGRIVWWSLTGSTNRDDLVARLHLHGSDAVAPDEPSSLVALHRAANRIARSMDNGEIHPLGRGHWAITFGAREEATDEKKTIAYTVRTEARLDGEVPRVTGDNEQAVLDAYYEERSLLSAADVGGWLCRKVEALGGVPLRPAGGVYFIPRDAVARWDAMSTALQAASNHKVHHVPAMRTEDAVDAILAAVTADTQAALEAITTAIPEMGKRALATREEETKALLARVGRYEGILGKHLVDLRGAIEETRMATAAAMLVLGGDEA